MSRVVVLNSGGFDSVVLAHHVFNNSEPDTEIYNLFFDYGQPCVASERSCSIKCAEKLGLVFKEIKIPPFDWSSSVLSGGSDESQYIPLRNLVFLSYALSFSESIGSSKVFCAFIDPECEYYNDTSPTFLENINVLSKSFGIEVEAPFIHFRKTGLLKSLAREYGVYRDSVHSCNYSDTPCGICGDCLALNEIFDSMDVNIPNDILIDSNFKVTDGFVQSVREGKITSAKLYINNSCQFSCSHCFIGKHRLIAEPLNMNEWLKVINDLFNAGIRHVDFFGKEPLFDEDIFTLLEECRSLGIDYSLITNGINVRRFIDELEEYKPVTTLSVETLYEDNGHRNTGVHILDTISLLLSRNIPVSVSIDLNSKNYRGVPNTIHTLYDLGVREFYIKPIRPFGDNEEKLMNTLIHPRRIYDTLDSLHRISDQYLDARFTISFSSMDLYRLCEYDKDLFYSNIGIAIHNRVDYVGNLFIDTELYCHRFQDMISITPDGYVLGCASEYCTDYSWCRNLRDNTLEECIRLGKDDINSDNFKFAGCYFCRFYKNSYKNFGKLLQTT